MSAKHWRRHQLRVQATLAELPQHVLDRLPPWLREGRCAAWDLQRAIATPPGSDQAVVRELYREARRRRMVVDHVEPLLGSPDVCGLHVSANLRLVPFELNATKGGRPTHRDPQLCIWPHPLAQQLPLFGARP